MNKYVLQKATLTNCIANNFFFFLLINKLQIRNVLQSLINRSLEHRHGSLLAISHAYYRKIKRCHTIDNNCPDFKKTVLILCGYLGDQQSLLVSAACKGLALIGSVACLPLPIGKEKTENAAIGSTVAQTVVADDSDQMQIDSDDEQVTKVHLLNTILNLLKSAHSRPKIREEAAVCLGHLSIGDGEFFTQRNLNAYTGLLKLVSARCTATEMGSNLYLLLFFFLQTRDVALNIAIAQGIVDTVLGFDHILHDGKLDQSSDPDINPYCDDVQLTTFLTSIIKIVPDPNPSSRNSSAIWLLALVKNCSKRAPIYTRRQLLQFAFSELLSDDSGALN